MLCTLNLSAESKELLNRVPEGKRSAFVSQLITGSLGDRKRFWITQIMQIVETARGEGVNINIEFPKD